MKPNSNFLPLLLSTLILCAALFALQTDIETRGSQKHSAAGTERLVEETSVGATGVLGVGAEGWTAIFTGGLLVFTMLLAAATFRLFQVTKDGIVDQSAATRNSIAEAARAANEMAKVAQGIEQTSVTNKEILEQQRAFWQRQMRAYLSADLGDYARQGKYLRFEFRIFILNHGSTPASNLRVAKNMAISRDGTVPVDFNYDFEEDDFIDSTTTLFAGQKKFYSAIFERKCSIGELRELLKGKARFHVWGEARYVDAFEVNRYTRFSYLIILPPSKRGRLIWHTDHRHNDAN